MQTRDRHCQEKARTFVASRQLRTGLVLAGGLLSAPVHTEVDDSQGAFLAEHTRICVDHLHYIGIHIPQSVGAPYKRARRIQA
jgi:hypothetical protein